MVNFNYTTILLISDKLYKKGKLIFWDDSVVSKVDIQLCKILQQFYKHLPSHTRSASKEATWMAKIFKFGH